jgi:hypothetical protein
MALTREMIHLVWLNLAKNPAKRRCVGQIAIMKKQILFVDVPIASQMFDARSL